MFICYQYVSAGAVIYHALCFFCVYFGTKKEERNIIKGTGEGGGGGGRKGYLFGHPADVLEVGVAGGGGDRGPQVGVDVGQHVWEQRGDVGVDGGEPGVSGGRVLAAQHHRVLPVGGVQLQQPAAHRSGEG